MVILTTNCDICKCKSICGYTKKVNELTKELDDLVDNDGFVLLDGDIRCNNAIIEYNYGLNESECESDNFNEFKKISRESV